MKLQDNPELQNLLYEFAGLAQEQLDNFTTKAKIELGLKGPTLGQIARALRTKLGETENYKYLEPEFVKRLDYLAETP